jgi:hypothetical protein
MESAHFVFVSKPIKMLIFCNYLITSFLSFQKFTLFTVLTINVPLIPIMQEVIFVRE